MEKLFLTNKKTATLAVGGIMFLIVAMLNWKTVAEAIFHMVIQPWGDLSATESIAVIGYYGNLPLACLPLGIISLAIALWRTR